MLNMFPTLIYPSSGACDYSVELPQWSYCSWFKVCTAEFVNMVSCEMTSKFKKICRMSAFFFFQVWTPFTCLLLPHSGKRVIISGVNDEKQEGNLSFEKLKNLFDLIIFLEKFWMDEVTGEWRKLHNEELNDFFSSPNIVRVIKSRRMRWAGHVLRMGEERGMYRVLVGKPEGRRPLGRPRRRWVDNIRMDLQ